MRRLAERQHREGRLLTLPERLSETREAAREMIAPTVYGQAIIFLVYAPLLTFTGVEGKTFSPMAITADAGPGRRLRAVADLRPGA